MGNVKSSVKNEYYDEDMYRASISCLKDSLNLSDIDILHVLNEFQKIDSDDTKAVHYDAFCKYYGLPSSEAFLSIYAYFCTNPQQPYMKFPEFVLFMLTFMTLDEEGMAKLLFLIIIDHNFHKSLLCHENCPEDFVLFILKQLFPCNDVAKINKVFQEIPFSDEDMFIKVCMDNSDLLLNKIRSYQLVLRRRLFKSKSKAVFWSQHCNTVRAVMPSLCMLNRHLRFAQMRETVTFI